MRDTSRFRPREDTLLFVLSFVCHISREHSITTRKLSVKSTDNSDHFQGFPVHSNNPSVLAGNLSRSDSHHSRSSSVQMGSSFATNYDSTRSGVAGGRDLNFFDAPTRDRRRSTPAQNIIKGWSEGSSIDVGKKMEKMGNVKRVNTCSVHPGLPLFL